MSEVNLFVYRLIPPRPTFVTDMSDDERAVMGEHAKYWTPLIESGRVVVFGSVMEPEGVWGLAVVEAGSAEEVRQLAEGDPAVRSGTCIFEIGALLPGAAVRARPEP